MTEPAIETAVIPNIAAPAGDVVAPQPKNVAFSNVTSTDAHVVPQGDNAKVLAQMLVNLRQWGAPYADPLKNFGETVQNLSTKAAGMPVVGTLAPKGIAIGSAMKTLGSLFHGDDVIGELVGGVISTAVGSFMTKIPYSGVLENLVGQGKNSPSQLISDKVKELVMGALNNVINPGAPLATPPKPMMASASGLPAKNNGGVQPT